MALASELTPSANDLLGAVADVLRTLQDSKGAGVDEALDTILETLGADRCSLLVVDGHTEFVRHARQGSGQLPKDEWDEISRTVVRRARESLTTFVWDAFDAEETESSLAEIGILAAAATPVIVGNELRGILYVDVRTPGKCIGAQHESFLAIAASILGNGLRIEHAKDEADANESRSPASQLALHELLAPDSMQDAANAVRGGLNSSMNILVRGASGTGKTALAMAFALALKRGPIVRATLGSSDDLNTITSELFGHERGAFSGATKRRVGLVSHADGGVLILDEVLNLPSNAQQLLLDFTQFGTYRPLGYDSASPRHADVRIVSVTQGNMAEAIEAGDFRRDLYHRLAGIEVHVPSLSERRTELPSLAISLLRRNDPPRSWELALGTRRLLARSSYTWPGNLRELESEMERARLRALGRSADTETITPGDLSPLLGASSQRKPPHPLTPPVPHDSVSLEERWKQLEHARANLLEEEADALRAGLIDEGGNVSRLARRIGVARTTLVHRIQLLGVDTRE